MADARIQGDPNMYTQGESVDGMEFVGVGHPAVRLEGFPWYGENGNFFRLPERIRAGLRERLAWVAAQPAGGVLRLRTDSRRLALRARLDRDESFRNQPRNLESGFDVYVGAGRQARFLHCVCPDERSVDYLVALPGELPEGMNDVSIYTPILNPVLEVKAGVDAGAALEAPRPHPAPGPICFYGSSITQGFCASRPGLAYPAIVCRELGAEMINLGFGGNAKGDLDVARAIAELDMACFVMDYDHNCEGPEHLAETHEPFFRVIREARPDLPVVFVTSPNIPKAPEFFGRRADVIRRTYDNAREAGDERVWFVHGSSLFPENWQDCTVDRLHPNDLGFHYMAQGILPAVRAALGQRSS